MSGSPIGSVQFTALGRAFTLKYGNRQRFRIEQEFGKGFAGVFLDVFPGVSPAMVLSGDTAGIAAAMKPQDIKLASIAVLFQCGVLEPLADDDLDAIIDELGYERVTELMGDAVAASSPRAEPQPVEAAADAPAGEARARGKTRKR